MIQIWGLHKINYLFMEMIKKIGERLLVLTLSILHRSFQRGTVGHCWRYKAKHPTENLGVSNIFGLMNSEY